MTSITTAEDSGVNNVNTKTNSEQEITNESCIVEDNQKEQEEEQQSSSIKDEKELLAEARVLMSEKDFSSASNLLSDALECLQHKGTTKQIDAVSYYMAYGEALLRLIQSSTDILSSSIQAQAQAQDADNNNNNEQAAAADMSEDREITWETFEFARDILEMHLQNVNDNKDPMRAQLALVHSMLGELLIEDGLNDAALSEFEKALVIHNECHESIVVHRQRAFDRVMACLSAQFCEQLDKAKHHCQEALREISTRIVSLFKQFECHDVDIDIDNNDDYKTLIVRGQQLMKQEQEKKEQSTLLQSEDGKELRDLIDSLEDLMGKLQEVRQSIDIKQQQQLQLEQQLQEDENGDANENEDEGTDEVANDALGNLIAGLTQKFGLAEELAQLEAQQAEQAEQSNNNNNNNNGVTTIGFGNQECNDDDEDDGVNELGTFGCKNNKKRSLEQAGFEQTVEAEPEQKKQKVV